MPATGGSRSARGSLSRRGDSKMWSPEPSGALNLPPSALPSSSTARPGLAARAHSTPSVSQMQHECSAQPEAGEEIADDVFFQRYHFPAAPAGQEQGGASDRSVDSSSDGGGPLSPTHVQQRRSQAPGAGVDRSSSNSSDDASVAVQHLNVAIIGNPGAGKSSFIRRTLSLPSSTAPAACHRKWTIDHVPYVVRFLELPLDAVGVSDRNTVEWPKTASEQPLPRIDGAVALYDVTSQASLADIPELLNTLATSHLPFIFVACKCDQHPAHREVDPAVVEQKARSFVGDLGVFQSSEGSPESARTCLSAITRAVIAARRNRSQLPTTRRRANSSAISSIRKDMWGKKHERASSEMSVRFRPASNDGKGHRHRQSDAHKTFFNADESPGYDSQDSDDKSDAGQSIMSVKPSDENGYTFDQLVDRLLAQPMSKADGKFVSIFLALYRRFATPGQLLEAILKRFEALDAEPINHLLRIIAQMRALAILQSWVAYYPGDFAYPTTRRLIRRFATSLAGNREFSVAATEIIRDLEMVTEDDDTDWACSDRHRASNDSIPAFHHNVLEEDSDDDADYIKRAGQSSIGSNRVSIARSTATGKTSSSGGSSQALLSQVEKNERLARNLEPNPIKSISKIQWHQLMSEPEDLIAKELTRIDWIMFSSVRPRDLVRHVSLGPEEKKKFKNLENVTRMTEHFNHVAYLVTNYILIREKPKHRALMLEKWMKVARQLRRLNNYNSLGAVLAGIKGTAIHRLIATRDLVPQATTHDFLKLDILMGPQKSHFAYRLAWENSSGERIPYIPLHRRDLVSASEGNATFVADRAKKTDSAFVVPHPGTSVFVAAARERDGREAPLGGVTGKERINWRKFEIMGEVIVGVQRAQGTPYPAWNKCEEVRCLVLDIRISKDDDELYERSTHLEAPGANEKGRFSKWFRER